MSDCTILVVGCLDLGIAILMAQRPSDSMAVGRERRRVLKQMAIPSAAKASTRSHSSYRLRFAAPGESNQSARSSRVTKTTRSCSSRVPQSKSIDFRGALYCRKFRISILVDNNAVHD